MPVERPSSSATRNRTRKPIPEAGNPGGDCTTRKSRYPTAPAGSGGRADPVAGALRPERRSRRPRPEPRPDRRREGGSLTARPGRNRWRLRRRNRADLANRTPRFLQNAAGGLADSAALPLIPPAAAPALPPDRAERKRLVHRAPFGRKEPVSGKSGMAITSHPLAIRDAVEVLRRGRNACDAAIAASVIQAVVEPHLTTITGCLSQLFHDAATGETTQVNRHRPEPRPDRRREGGSLTARAGRNRRRSRRRRRTGRPTRTPRRPW